MAKSILKNHSKILPIYRKISSFDVVHWKKLFNFENLAHNISQQNGYIFNGFAIKETNHHYIAYPVEEKTYRAEFLEQFIDLDLAVIKKIVTMEKVAFSDIQTLSFYCGLDLFDRLSDGTHTIGSLMGSPGLPDRNFVRSHLLETNKNAFYLAKVGKNIISNKSLPTIIMTAFQSSGLHSLELPVDYDTQKTLQFLNHIVQVMDSIAFPKSRRGLNIRFKKLGIYKDDGYYSHETNTIILDPRKTEIFWHELGHLIYDNNVRTTLRIKAKNSEEYAEKVYSHLPKKRKQVSCPQNTQMGLDT